MKILVCSSEASPLVKTGGLADYTTALSKALAELGHEVWLVLPSYRQLWRPGAIDRQNCETVVESIRVPMGARSIEGKVLQTKLPDSKVTLLLIDQPDYFNRAELYRERGEDYPDNCERFVFFCRAALDAAALLKIDPDIIHANDWQTGLVPVLVETELRNVASFTRCATIFTIHNLAYQGVFNKESMEVTGLDWTYFNWRQMEFYGRLNLLKSGIVFANMVTTVSPQHARDILTPPLGCGLEGTLATRATDLVGVLNGSDTKEWNPATDDHIKQLYDVTNWRGGKSACKRDLQIKLGLPQHPNVPLLGMLSRFSAQKGFDTLVGALPRLLNEEVQIAILGLAAR